MQAVMIEKVFYSVPHKLGYFEKRDDWVRRSSVVDLRKDNDIQDDDYREA
jgi:hypothetical protein